jgi:hypothetical protein
MAKQVENGTEQREDPRSLIAMTKAKLKSLLARCRTKTVEMDEARGAIGGLINAACDKDRCHKQAFGWVRRLDRMDEAKRQEWLFHFDIYREHMAWEHVDMLPDRQPDELAARRRRRAGGAETVGSENEGISA